MREVLQPPAFFEALGVRYVGPVDGHDIAELEHAFRNAIELSARARSSSTSRRRRAAATRRPRTTTRSTSTTRRCSTRCVGPPKAVPTGYTQAFAEAIIKEADADSRIVAITAAMAGPTGLLPFQARFPDRFFDVGIAEQHAVTGAAGMAMGGLRPVVAIYSTFLNRAWDQVVYDVALHRLPVVFCLDRAGITGPDGASHHGVYDMALLARVPGMRVLAPSSAQELQQMLHDATSLADGGPVAIRYPRGQARDGRRARRRRRACAPGGSAAPSDPVDQRVCVLAIGKLVEAAEKAADIARRRGHRRVAVGRPLLRAARRGHARRRRPPPRRRHVSRTAFATAASACRSRTASAPSRPTTLVEVLGTPNRFLPHDGRPERILARLGLDADGIAATVRRLM